MAVVFPVVIKNYFHVSNRNIQRKKDKLQMLLNFLLMQTNQKTLALCLS